MARYIDADALISVLEDMRERHRKNLFFVSANAYDGAVRIVKAIKTIEARPVVCGEWNIVNVNKQTNTITVECNECGVVLDLDMFLFGLSYDFCPNCGADNRGE